MVIFFYFFFSVAAIICTSGVELRFSYLSITPPESPLWPLLGAKESSSSKKIIQGAAVLALLNTDRDREGNVNKLKKNKQKKIVEISLFDFSYPL